MEFSGPLDVEFGVTKKCQLRCGYCSAMPLSGDHAPSRRSIEVIEELGELGVYALLISGGEPTLHPAFIELVSTAARAIPSISINTNGIRLADIEYAKVLKQVAPNALVSISLDSPNHHISDIERGAGGKRAIQAIENCISVDQTVCISCVLTESNLDDAIHLIDRFSTRIRKFRFFPRVPRNQDDLERNESSYYRRVSDFYSKLRAISIARPELDLLAPTPIQDESFLENRRGACSNCICASTKLYINELLDVYPCYYSASQQNKIGSCVNVSLSSLWKSSKANDLRHLSKNSRLCGVRFGENEIPVRYTSA